MTAQISIPSAAPPLNNDTPQHPSYEPNRWQAKAVSGAFAANSHGAAPGCSPAPG